VQTSLLARRRCLLSGHPDRERIPRRVHGVYT
jgi:hypothetical protein